MSDALEDFNQENKELQSLNLVLFESAVDHINRISRVLNFAKGNVLLIGPSGSGKTICSRLASFIFGCKYFSTTLDTD